jgi:general secretion pathway protein D
VGVVRLICVWLLCAALFASEPHTSILKRNRERAKRTSPAAELIKKAKAAEKKGNNAQAYLHYAQAAAADPQDETGAWMRSVALRTSALLESNYMPTGLGDASDVPAPADPALAAMLGEIEYKDLEEARQPAPPTSLVARPGDQSFDLRGTTQEIYEEVARAFELDVIFDSDFKQTKPIRITIDDADHREALRIVGVATSTFLVPVSDTLFLVAEDTQQKRQDLELNMAAVVPLPETVDVQEAQELARAVQQVMEIKKLVVDGTRRMVLIRDRVSRVRPAEALFRQLLQPRPEVVMDVEFLEISKTSSLSYGIDWPKSISIAFLGIPGAAGFMPLGNLITANLWGFTIGNAELVAQMSRSNSRTLLRAQLRAVSGQPANLHVGDRYPIQNNAYVGDTSGSGQVFTPPPQISFEDLGTVLKITPYVHGSDGVSMEVEAEFKVLAGESSNGIPVLANRNFQAGVRLRANEWAIMSGMVKGSESKTITGIAGLSDIPYLGKFFSVTHDEKEDRRVLLVIKPSIVRNPAAADIPALWTGTETRPNPIM